MDVPIVESVHISGQATFGKKIMSARIVQTQVLIVGGGPSGLMLANELGRLGIRCLLVDTKPDTAFNPQANATQARTMEYYRRLGFAHEIRALGLPADHPTDIAYFTRIGAHELARLRLPTAAQAVRAIRGLKGSWSAAELPHRISQKYVEPVLRRHAEKWPCNDIRYGWSLQQFSKENAAISARIAPSTGEGEALAVRADFLVGADGPRSLVRHTLGIGYEGPSGTRRGYMGGQMFAVYLRAPGLYERLPHDRAWMYVTVNHERRALLASVDGVCEFAFHAAVQDGEPADSWGPDEARDVVRQALGFDFPIEVLNCQTWTAGHALVAQRFSSGRVFLVGDAAHLFTPTGGLGYNTGVEDAVNLGWKLAAVLRGQAGVGLLDSYAIERQAIARRNTGYARRFADSVGLYPATPELEAESDAGRAARAHAAAHFDAHVRLEFNIPGVSFGGRYDDSPAIVSENSPAPADEPNVYTPTAKPGGRPPHAWLEDGRSLYDTFGPEWTLLSLGAQSADTASFEAAAALHGIKLSVVRHADPELARLYESRLVLIRPDQVVAWRGEDASGAARALEALLARD